MPPAARAWAVSGQEASVASSCLPTHLGSSCSHRKMARDTSALLATKPPTGCLGTFQGGARLAPLKQCRADWLPWINCVTPWHRRLLAPANEDKLNTDLAAFLSQPSAPLVYHAALPNDAAVGRSNHSFADDACTRPRARALLRRAQDTVAHDLRKVPADRATESVSVSAARGL